MDAEASSQGLPPPGDQPVPDPPGPVDPTKTLRAAPDDASVSVSGLVPETPAGGSPDSHQTVTPPQIDRYLILGRLGAGGYGHVYRAFDPVIRREVAIKVPGRPQGWTQREEEAFLDEARHAAMLKHPHIVTIYDAGRSPQHGVYIVMEYVAGQTLSQTMAQQRLEISEAVRIVRQAAEAVHVAHQQGIIHRDLKPSNILLDRHGHVYVTDFGLAILEQRLLQQSGNISGTPAYMAPEQIGGRTEVIDSRVDIWSLGVILYECLTGRRPFQAKSVETLRQLVAMREPTPLRLLNEAVPKSLEEICLKCLAKRVADRYATCRDLAEALSLWAQSHLSAVSGTGTSSTTYPLSGSTTAPLTPAPVAGGSGSQSHPPLPGLLPRSRRGLVAAVVGVAALIALAAGGWLDWRRPGGLHSQEESGGSDPAARAGVPAAPVPPTPPQVVHTVVVQTTPPGARIVVYPLDRNYGFPAGAGRVEAAERSPATLKLKPGEYFVVAALDETRFHEVYRYVPQDPQSVRPQSYNHWLWSVQVDGSLVWPEITIPESEVSFGMGLFTGSPRFRMGQALSTTIPAHDRRIPPFYLDAREVTWGDLLDQSPSWESAVLSPFKQRGETPPRDFPVAPLWHDEAVAWAEALGKRLPTEAEYEFAATAGGKCRFPWGDDAERITEWTFGPAGTPEFDCLEAGVPVFGLYSNVAEWTASWASAYPPLLDDPASLPAPIPGMYTVRGAPGSVILGRPLRQEFHLGPRNRVGQHDRTLSPQIGFRCARSFHPPLEASDLEQYLPLRR
jgi:predicted Ser/Thr protein kinase